MSPEEREIWADEDDREVGPEAPLDGDETAPELEEDNLDYDPLDDDLDDHIEEEPVLPPSSAPTLAAGDESDSFLPKFSRRDLGWLGALALVLLLIVIFGLKLFFGDINTHTPDDVDFPVKGENVVVKSIESYWRKPDREKDKGVQMDARFIPAADIRLKSSGTGALRIFFENPEGERIGDSVTRAFSNGSFDETGEDTISIYATGGFENLGEHNDYLSEKVKFWRIVVLEGSGLEAEGSSFNEILRVRISPRRR